MSNSEKEISAAFNKENNDRSIKMVRVSAVLAIVLYLVFFVLDYFIFREYFVEFAINRIITIILIVMIFWLSHTRFGIKNIMSIGMLSYIITAISISIMISSSGGYKSPYYAGLFIVVLFMCILLPISNRRGIVTAVVIYLIYLMPILASGDISEFSVFLSNNFFLITTIVIALATLIFSNKIRFQEFSSRYSLANANKELSKLDELKSQFFSNVSHEIRTPLTSIISPLEILNSTDIADLPADERSSIIQQMNLNSKKLLKLINDLLDFSKLEAEMMKLQCRKADMKNIWEELLASTRTMITDSGLTLETNFPAQAVELFVDVAKLDKVFLNLLSNAIKFTSAGGKITISIKEEESKVFVSVSDTGIGIPPEVLPHMFERFHQVDGSSTRKYSGTGIGLNLAKEFVKLHHGDIKVESQKGVGSVFTIELLKGREHLKNDDMMSDEAIQALDEDRRQGERRNVERRQIDARDIQLADLEADRVMKKIAKEALAKEGMIKGDGSPIKAFGDDGKIGNKNFEPWVMGGKKADIQNTKVDGKKALIHVVDDDAGIVILIKNALQDLYKIQAAFDGEQGWNMINASLPDLIISDLMMPKMNGYELTSMIKQAPHTKHIPVIMLTAKGELNFKIQGLEMGADDYLAKPFNKDELRARIRSLLNLRALENELAKTNRDLEASYKKLKDAETQLINTDKIRALGIMLMGLAHELNNPLSFIMGGAKGLEKLLKKQENLDRKEDLFTLLGSVNEGVSRCSYVMDELRKFIRQDSLHYSLHSINEIIDSTAKFLNQLAKDRIEIVKEYKTESKVECVPGLISQVMMNILHNAILAIKDKGTIKIKTYDDGGKFLIEVSDSGQGISKENLKKVFDPFFTTRDPNKGMGLGLSVSYKIVSDHGGNFEIFSEEGRGTTAKITLPLKQSEEGKYA